MANVTADFISQNARLSGECWEWRGARSANGYGAVRDGASIRGAHRVSYEIHVGLIPAGMVLDHLCRNRACVNPAHLEPVTNRENILRGESPSAIAARATHCVHGHEFTVENTRVRPTSGKRSCRTCIRTQKHAAWKKKTSAAGP